MNTMVKKAEALFGEEVTVKHPCNSTNGYFLRLGHQGGWYRCREQFQAFINTEYSFYMYVELLPAKRHIPLACFILKTEIMLGLKNFTTYNRTNFTNVVKINMSPFWCKNNIRKTLFTALLRAPIGGYGETYDLDKDNYFECIDACQYLQHSKSSFYRFMAGYTCLKEDKNQVRGSSGWAFITSSYGPKCLIVPAKS